MTVGLVTNGFICPPTGTGTGDGTIGGGFGTLVVTDAKLRDEFMVNLSMPQTLSLNLQIPDPQKLNVVVLNTIKIVKRVNSTIKIKV